MTIRMSTLVDHLELPIIAAPMFLVSSPQLVIEACKSGIIGSFPMLNARTNEILENWMVDISTALEEVRGDSEKKVGPWAVNLIVHGSNSRFEEDLKLIQKYKPPIVITSLGDPSKVTEIVHSYGGFVFSDVINVSFAKKAIQKGVDGLILVCSGAGGHSGVISPFAFMSAVREFWDGLTILGGAISTGKDILAAEVLGADFVYMGTRFIAASESFAETEYQKMLIDSTFEEIIYTDVFSGVNANYLMKSIKRAGIDPSNLPDKRKMDFSEMTNPQAKAWRDIWSAGHGVSTIKEVKPISEIVKELKESYIETLSRFK